MHVQVCCCQLLREVAQRRAHSAGGYAETVQLCLTHPQYALRQHKMFYTEKEMHVQVS